MHIGAHAEIQDWKSAYGNLETRHQDLKADYCALEAQRDAAYNDENGQGLKAKRGTFGGRVWGREKMGEVWRMQGEFVWVRVEERDWVGMLGLRGAKEGVERGGKKVRECLGEVRDKIGGRRRRSVVPRMVRDDLS